MDNHALIAEYAAIFCDVNSFLVVLLACSMSLLPDLVIKLTEDIQQAALFRKLTLSESSSITRYLTYRELNERLG